MVDPWFAVRRRRAFEEGEGRGVAAARLDAGSEGLLIAPGLHQGCFESDRIEVAHALGYCHRAGDLRSCLEVEGVAQRASVSVCKVSKRASDGIGSMTEAIRLDVGGMTCDGCAGRVRSALEELDGVISAAVSHEAGSAVVEHSGVERNSMVAAVLGSGYTVDGQVEEYSWGDGATWRQAANNTKWCLIGCSIGEFGTLGYYQYAGWPLEVAVGTTLFWFLVVLPLINGLATSVTLETVLLMRGQMDFSNALSTAFGMSFISMLGMEIAMEATDWLLTGGMGMTWWVIPPMLIVGFLTPWPYNYWRLKKFGVACH